MTDEPTLGLSDEEVSEVWPFVLAIDAKGIIAQQGRGWQEMSAGELCGLDIEALFDWSEDSSGRLELWWRERGLCLRGRALTRGDGALLLVAPAAPTREVYTSWGSSWFGGTQELVAELEAKLASVRAAQQATKFEATGRLIGAVAHDFNNILVSILGYSELVLEDMDPADVLRQDVELIWEAGQRGAKFTKRLLSFARHDPDSEVLIDAGAALLALEERLVSMLDPRLFLEMSVAGELGDVRMVPGGLELLLVNLVANARDAMPEGGAIRVQARRDVQLEGGDCLHVVVRDEGEGMDAETQARVFDPFFTTKSGGEGKGLGLSVVYGMVHRAGGRVHVESAPGKGTSVEVWLPLEPDVLEAQLSIEELSVISAAWEAGGRVLMVESDRHVRGLMARALREADFEVVEVAEAEAAEQMLEGNGAFDAIVCASTLPGSSGRDLLARHTTIPAVLVAGRGTSAVDEVVLLHKPFEASRLVASVRRAIRECSLRNHEHSDAFTVPQLGR